MVWYTVDFIVLIARNRTPYGFAVGSFITDRGILIIFLMNFNLTVTQKTITIGISSISYTGYQRRRGIVRKLDLQRAAGGCEAAGRFPQLAVEFSPEAQKRG